MQMLDLPFLLSFDSLLPEIGHLGDLDLQEESLTKGPFSLIDCYCPIPWCDCCKVSLLIRNQDDEVIATIAYGWKSVAYYRRWGLDKMTSQCMTLGFLDPLEKQSEQASLFLKFFRAVLKSEPGFKKTLQYRYGIFKEMVEMMGIQKVQSLVESVFAANRQTTKLTSAPPSSTVVDFASYQKFASKKT